MTAQLGPITETDFFRWSCLISGPSETPFEGGVFEAELTFPRDYPLSPPKVRQRLSSHSRIDADNILTSR